MRKSHYLLLCVGLLLATCKETNTPTEKDKTLTTPFTQGYALYYGSYYSYMGIDTPVFELDLYTEQLGLDTAGQYTGKGTNLYLSDIFTPATGDTLLPAGTYTIDTAYTYRPYTIMAGRSLGGFPAGSYATTVSDMSVSYDYITTGQMTVEYLSNDIVLTFDLRTHNGNRINNHYKGRLPHLNLSISALSPTNPKKIHPSKKHKLIPSKQQ